MKTVTQVKPYYYARASDAMPLIPVGPMVCSCLQFDLAGSRP